jgi:hypothetical protein
VTTLSVREIAERRLGVSGDLSMDTDVYGYIYRDDDGSLFGTLASFDVLPGTGGPTTRSLKRHLEMLDAVCIDVVLFKVAHEADFTGVFTRDDVTKAQYAVQVARDLYATVNLGIRSVIWRGIGNADGLEFVNVENDGDVRKLARGYSGPPGSVDVFLVQTIDGFSGLSPTNGPCNKDTNFETTGCAVALDGDRFWTGRTLAHEIGHYLGLDHEDVVTNLMARPSNYGSLDITSDQATKMKDHCMAQPAAG